MKVTHSRPVTHVLFVPTGWTLDDVIAEINVFGEIDAANEGDWHIFTCDGNPCVCPQAQPAPDARFYRDGVLVRDLCDDNPRPWACKARRWWTERVLRR